MASGYSDPLYKTLVRAILFAAGVIIALWLLHEAAGVILILLFAIILALVINTPVAALEKRGMKRFWASMVVFGIILVVLGLMAWLIVPKISDQLTTLINNLPDYAQSLSNNMSRWFRKYPHIDKQIQEQGINLSNWAPSVPGALMQIGNYSLSIITIILVTILFVSMVVYSVTRPRPLLHLYFSMFSPSHQAKATEALQHTSVMLNGWIRSNVIGGIIRGGLIIVFLSIMGVPGAWVWGAIAFFAELIPKLGFYIMAIPPIIMSFAVSPMTALWVTIFMLALDELMGDFILPRIRSTTMNIHPVSILFVLLAMASVFGVLGALLATPVTAIIKAYYEAFFMKRTNDEKIDAQIDAVLYNSDARNGKPDARPGKA